MSDEDEESMSEGFSASEDEWKPSAKDVRGGESSDDDDSDFEEVNETLVANSGTSNNVGGRRREAKSKIATKQAGIKKRKPAGQSLRTKLFNKYRPPPKTVPSPSRNSPSASTSHAASKNAKAPNESVEYDHDSSSESSVEDYLVNPSELDLQSSFFNVRGEGRKSKSASPAPLFDCNAGIANLSDSDSEDNNDSSADEQAKAKAFDFGTLLDNVNSLERAKETIAKRAAATKTNKEVTQSKTKHAEVMDVHSLLALGEKKCDSDKKRVSKSERVAKDKDSGDEDDVAESAPSKLSKTKSTRVKRHTKTRPTSTVVAGDTDDSDWEEVADDTNVSHSAPDTSTSAAAHDSLEICIELPSRQRHKKQQKQQQDLELALRRKLNREMKDRQLLLHKTSLLCCFGRSYNYNRLLNDTALMQGALKLLPSSNAYPPERGTEIKYFQSLVTWFKTVIKLNSPNLYADKQSSRKVLSKQRIKRDLLEQIKKKEARCKQDMIFIFVILMRGMGLQCRLVMNLQPLPLRPAQADLLSIKMKRDADVGDGDKKVTPAKKAKVDESSKHGGKEGTQLSQSPAKTQNQESKAGACGKKKTDSEVNGASKREAQQEPKSDSRKRIKKSDNGAVDANSKSEAELKETPDKKIKAKREQEKNRKHQKIPTDPSSKNGKQSNTESHRVKKGALKLPSSQTKAEETPQVQITETAAQAASKDIAQNEQPSKPAAKAKPQLAKLGKTKTPPEFTPIACRTRQKPANKNESDDKAPQNKTVVQVSSPVIPKIVIHGQSKASSNVEKKNPHERENMPNSDDLTRRRSRSTSPKLHISPDFLHTKTYQEKFPTENQPTKPKRAQRRAASSSPAQKFQISTEFLQAQGNVAEDSQTVPKRRILRTRQKSNDVNLHENQPRSIVPQLDGADDLEAERDVGKSRSKRPQLRKLQKPAYTEATSANESDDATAKKPKRKGKRRPKLEKLQKSTSQESANESAPKSRAGRGKRLNLKNMQKDSDEDFEPSPTKRPKKAPVLPTPEKETDRHVISPDEEEEHNTSTGAKPPNPQAADIWVEVWCDVEEQWVCIDIFKGKLHSIEAIRRAASSNLAYVFAFQNDLSIKDVTARYCAQWTTTMRKSRVDHAWLEQALSPYYGQRTKRDLLEDQELRRIHEEKPLPTSISEYKNNPLYALERHLLKFQAIYPPDAPTLGFIRGEPVYARDCVYTLHSRDIWLKQARTVKLGEQPYKIVKARPKWDRLTQTVIKDQPLEIFGYWQTEEYDPPTAENGIVPRNAYGNVELFKECMLPKKTVHLRLPGLQRICKKLGIDCANAVIGFDFHQGACHPLYDGFVVCEEFGDQVTAVWHQDQEEQERKEQEKYEARVWGNWRKLIRGLFIRERIKKKYNV